MSYNGLWLDHDYSHGYSKGNCLTYESPQLSGKEEFKYEQLEVWGVGPDPTIVKDDDEVIYMQQRLRHCKFWYQSLSWLSRVGI